MRKVATAFSPEPGMYIVNSPSGNVRRAAVASVASVCIASFVRTTRASGRRAGVASMPALSPPMTVPLNTSAAPVAPKNTMGSASTVPIATCERSSVRREPSRGTAAPSGNVARRGHHTTMPVVARATRTRAATPFAVLAVSPPSRCACRPKRKGTSRDGPSHRSSMRTPSEVTSASVSRSNQTWNAGRASCGRRSTRRRRSPASRASVCSRRASDSSSATAAAPAISGKRDR